MQVNGKSTLVSQGRIWVCLFFYLGYAAEKRNLAVGLPVGHYLTVDTKHVSDVLNY